MPNTQGKIRDLAKTLISDLRRRRRRPVRIELITELLQTMYNASLISEESKYIRFNIAFLDPARPDPDPPFRIRRNRWQFIPLAKPIPFQIEQILKLAHASDPRSSLLVIYPDGRGTLKIWGFVDQQNCFDEFARFDADSYFAPPGLFHAGVLDIGRVVVSIESVKIAELRVNKLMYRELDVIHRGPIHRSLAKGFRQHIRQVRTLLPKQFSRRMREYQSSLKGDWLASICRILLRAKGFAHGGAILITPNVDYRGLNLKYELEYSRLQKAMAFHGESYVRMIEAHEKSSIIIDNNNNMPIDIHLDEVISSYEHDDCDSEIDGAIWFVSLLTRVDGMVLMTPDLKVKGFGVEITVDKPPTKVVSSLNEEGTKTKIVDYNHFGTRHRSMMRYCNYVQGSVGFVISQDGHVRGIMKRGREIVIWTPIKIDAIASTGCKSE